jgi:hypothetical protein
VRRGALVASTLVVLAADAAGQESPPAVVGAERAFVEVVASKREPFVGEAFELRLRFGFDADLLANHLVPLFARELDLPVQVEWDPERTVDALKFRTTANPTAGTRRFALGESVARATPLGESVRDGRRVETFELVHRVTAARGGALVVPAASLRFACASKIEDDLIRGRVPVDRQVVRIEGAALALNVLPLPDEGRPTEFTGAVGRRTLAASASPTRLVAGESVQLTLTIGGDGDPAAFGAPDLSHIAGFVLRGVLDTPGAGAREREIVYDLAPLDPGVREIPALEFSWFSPEAPVGYVTERTAPIALAVAPRGNEPGAGGAAAPDAATARAVPDRRSTQIAALVAAGVAILAAFLFVVRRSARRDDAAADSASVRGGTAAATFRARVAAPGADVAAAFIDYLAARLGVAPAAVVSPDLAQRLERNGVPRELAASVAARLAALVAARYAGGAASPAAGPSDASSDVARLFEQLERPDLAPRPAAGGAAARPR